MGNGWCDEENNNELCGEFVIGYGPFVRKPKRLPVYMLAFKRDRGRGLEVGHGLSMGGQPRIQRPFAAAISDIKGSIGSLEAMSP